VPAQTPPTGLAIIVTLSGSVGLTVIVSGFEVTGLPETHVSDEVIITVTTSLSFSTEDEYVELLPTTDPFNLHTYAGDPPLTGIAVNVTIVPSHTGPTGAADILTPAAPGVVTDMVMALEVAVLVVAQGEVEVITTLTTSLFESVADVNVGLFIPTFVELTLHWYDGVGPPFEGVAVNITVEPAQIEPIGAAAMVTLGVTEGVTDITIGFDIAGLPVTHGSSDVMATVTTSPVVSAEEV
jgi:hypothetical protein